MQNEIFERILQGEPVALAPNQLLEFQGFCSARSFSLDQLIAASVTLFRISPDYSYQFLSYVDRHELSKPIYNDYQHQNAKINIYNNLTGLVLAKVAREVSKEEAEKLMGEAKRYLNSSEKVRMTVDKSIILNRALLHYYAGEVTKALNLVGRIYEEIQKTGQGKNLLVSAMIMLAQINFLKKNYQKALDFYKKCLETNRSLPTKARIGMAYSFFYLGKYEMARACFQRIIQLDPSSVEAHVGIATVYEREDQHQKYFEYMSLAYKINKRHPLVLVHLAEHYLLRKELHKSQKFCQEGLVALEKYSKFPSVEEHCRNDYEDMKARFNNILGQVNHIGSNYFEATKYYTLASGKGLLHNEIALAQCYVNPNTQNYLEAIKLLQECYRSIDEKDHRLLNQSFKLMAYLKSKVPPRHKEQKNAQYYYAEAVRFNRHDFDSKIEFANILVDINKHKALQLLEDARKIQLTIGNDIKPELQNNIAVLELENDEPDLCEKRLQQCLDMVRSQKIVNQQDEVKNRSLSTLVKFNYGVCMERQAKWYSAKKIYQEILQENKYHVDSALRLAYIWMQLGSYRKVSEILESIDKVCEENRKTLRAERYFTIKAYIQHLCGSSVEAKDSLKMLGKAKDIYSQILELCINYENLIRKGVEANILKEFLRPNRQFCYKYCKEDPHATMAYMLLAIVFLADKKFTKAQGIDFFNNLKQFSADDMPTILYNMAFFLMNYDDYENAIVMFGLYREKAGWDPRTDELIALNYLLENDLNSAEAYVKKNILKYPCNLKYKLQHSYILERRSHQYYEKGVFKKFEVEKRLQELRSCLNTHIYFGKVSISDSIRTIECPELKERVKNIYMKVKACGQERKFYIKSYIDSFEKVLKDLSDAETKRVAEEQRVAANIMNSEKDRVLQKLLEDEEQSVDEEEQERKEKERKRQRALQLAKKRQAQMDEAWNDLKAKDKQLMQQKKSRKRGPRVPTAAGPIARKKEKVKEKSESEPEYEQEPEQLPSEEDAGSFEESEEDGDKQFDSEPKKKHKKEKNKKKHKKHKHRKRSEDESEQKSQKSEKKEPENQDNNDEEELLKYML